MTNPLPEIKGSHIITGAFDVTLKTVTVEKREKYQEPDILEDNLVFTFEVPEEGIDITKYVGLKTNKKSNLYKLCSSMAPGTFSDDVMSNRDTLWPFLQSLIGKTYVAMCQPNDGQTYTKIMAISPKKAGKASAGKNVAMEKMAATQPSFDDDDVPVF